MTPPTSFIGGVITGLILFYMYGADLENDDPKIGQNIILYKNGTAYTPLDSSSGYWNINSCSCKAI